MTHLSLFSGIGGIDLAAEWAGFTTVGFVEWSLYCQQVLAKNFPGVPIHADISTFDPDPFYGVDLVSGGFPCQDVSVANQNNATGIEGERTSLFRHALRVVRAVRPKFLLLENVSGLIIGRGIGVVLGELAAMGFDAIWGSPQVSSVGGYHERERVFILAHPSSERYQELESKVRDAYSHGREYSTAKAQWHLSELQTPPRGPRVLRPVPNGELLRMVDGVPCELDPYHAYGNAVSPPQVYPLLTVIAEALR